MTQPAERWGWVPLGQMLVQDGILTDEQVASALERQRKTKERLGQVLIEMHLIDEEVLLKYLGSQFRKEPITRPELATLDLDVVNLGPWGRDAHGLFERVHAPWTFERLPGLLADVAAAAVADG